MHTFDAASRNAFHIVGRVEGGVGRVGNVCKERKERRDEKKKRELASPFLPPFLSLTKVGWRGGLSLCERKRGR